LRRRHRLQHRHHPGDGRPDPQQGQGHTRRHVRAWPTQEATGGSEIEISFAFVDTYDIVIVKLSSRSDRLVFTSDGIDVGNDGDRDILTAGTAQVRVYGQGGNDRIDASAYSGSRAGHGVALHGGPGNDTLIGSTIANAEGEGNLLYGDDGDDVLIGGDSSDYMYGGMGDDRMVGHGGEDFFGSEATVDGADDMRGGDGIDWVDYGGFNDETRRRTNGVTVTIGDTEPDGEPGEGDLVRGDVENVSGGAGPDVLVGNGLANALEGGYGDDELYGGGGDDGLYGGRAYLIPNDPWDPGNDVLVGDEGNDTFWGGGGDDFLDGGLGADRLLGETGADLLHGGPGPDALDGGPDQDEFHGDGGNDTFFNDDGFAETVDCGPGLADDPQPSSLDTFIACELI
jgi:Ca2+-binding RTX toxin-like protein